MRHVVHTKQICALIASEKTDNRVLWALAARTCPDNSTVTEDMHTLEPLISFYISISDGTSVVERALGRHAKFLERHQGSPDHDMAEVCFEIASEGPGKEDDIFQKAGDALLLLPVSRTWARLWRTLYSRRFACYKQRENTGQKNTGWRLKGSMKAVGMWQARATDTLASRAQQTDRTNDQPTIVRGVSRQDLARVARRDSGSVPGKKLRNFRECTGRNLVAKSMVPSWAGFGAHPRPLRCKSGQVAPWMIACPRKPGLQSGTWTKRAA